MVPCITLEKLVSILSAEPLHCTDDRLQRVAQTVVTDSRTITTGQIFLALRGETFDGHQFVEAALQQGAIAAITDHLVTGADGTPLPQLVVSDTLVAYQAIAHWWRNQFTIPIIAVTGSVGKTTTKELIAAVLSTQGKVLKTQANYNNEIGVPKTLLELTPDHDFAVIEMGMRAAGEIALLAKIARPTLAVITNVGTAHIGRLGSEEAIAQAKCELLAESPPEAIAILNHDNPLLLATAELVWTGKTLSFGLAGGDVQGELLDLNRLKVGDLTFPLPLPGRHNALNYLAALTVARALHLDWAPLTQGIAVHLPQGRAQRHTLPNNIVILDETYNAGLESMLASLQLLQQTPGQRHLAILGTMKELGDRSVEFHAQVGQQVRSLPLDHLLILADPAESLAMAEAAAPVPTEQFTSHEAVIARLQTLVKPGDRLLFKASRAVGLDQVVTQFLKSIGASEA